MTRPQTLAEVALECPSLNEFSMRLADFLHEFAAHPEIRMLSDEPTLLRDSIGSGEVADAYLAATAAALARQLHVRRPEWTEAPERYLRRPWFARPGASMRACLLLESPSAFRERNLFVTANALSVA
ncbi:MAG: hypothetical protein ABJF23_29770 [Bryobacteraceae bacterium]